MERLHTPGAKHSLEKAILFSVIAITLVLLLSVPCLADPQSQAPEGTYVGALTSTWSLEKPLKAEGELSWGLDVRTRYVDLDKVADLGLDLYPDPVRRFFRIRGRLWFAYGITSNVQAYARLTNESRIYLKCESCESKFDEIIFENFYFEARNPFGLPIATRIGRQDLFYGDGFLICDGGPLDGSRTAYVNGIVISGKIPLWAFDVFAIYDPRSDEYLPCINNQHRKVIEHDELLCGIMLARLGADGNSRQGFEPYFLFKEESASGSTADIYTFGMRLTVPSGFAKFTGEIAYQAGRLPDIILPEGSSVARPETTSVTTVGALGARGSLSRSFRNDGLALAAGYLYLSGDDPITRGKFEGWNPILGRWPSLSELYIYTLMLESDAQPMGQGIAFWQNLKGPFLRLSLKPARCLSITASYMWLDANHSVFFDPKLGGHSHRGELYTAKLVWHIKDVINGHVLFERFAPGDFYQPGAKPASFFRIELGRTFP